MLPKDPFILLSYINTQLRDNYPSLEALCEDRDEDESAIVSALEAIGYRYSAEQNKFV